jgi:hypothetical protein
VTTFLGTGRINGEGIGYVNVFSSEQKSARGGRNNNTPFIYYIQKKTVQLIFLLNRSSKTNTHV